MTTETSVEDGLRRRLLAKVVIPDNPDACWEWTGAVNKNGRAHMQADKRGTYSNASRIAYRVFIGPLADDEWALHTCDNSLCCNPRHLYQGDHVQNMRDMAERGRMAGERHPASKITAEEAAVIRSSKERSRVLADRYGLSMSHIAHIRKGNFWKER